MKSKKSKARFGSAGIIYLAILLGVVLLYLAFIYPKLATKISSTNNQTQNLRMEINILRPYASEIVALNEKSEKDEKEYEANQELDEPIMFSNILYECADKANVTLTNIGITTNDVTEISGKLPSENSSASISLTAENNAQIERFILLLEQNEGSAMSVQNLNYSLGDGAITAGATIIMYTVKK